MGGASDMELIKKDGTRAIDGRKPDQMREVTIKAGVLHRADGSAYLEWGGNKVLAAVYGPREAVPRHSQRANSAVVKVRYNMAPFSVDDRKRPGPDRRSAEISKVTAEALENVVLIEQFPRAQIDVNIEILEAEAGTRCAGITAASVALADAGIPMKGMVAGCAAGKVGDTVVLDLGKEEDNFGQADVPVALNLQTDEVVLLQMDGHLTPKEFDRALELAMEGCRMVGKIQKQALMERYAAEAEGAGNDEEEE